MNLYLVIATIRKTKYEVDGEETFRDTRIVWAGSGTEAKQIVEKYWNDKTDMYSVYYDCSANATEAMGQNPFGVPFGNG